MKRQEVEAKIIGRALDDPDFREKLLANPKEAIRTTARIKVREEIEIEVLQETAGKFYIVLPAPAEELSEEQLEAVAGGTAAYESRRLGIWHTSSR